MDHKSSDEIIVRAQAYRVKYRKKYMRDILIVSRTTKRHKKIVIYKNQYPRKKKRDYSGPQQSLRLVKRASFQIFYE